MQLLNNLATLNFRQWLAYAIVLLLPGSFAILGVIFFTKYLRNLVKTRAARLRQASPALGAAH